MHMGLTAEPSGIKRVDIIKNNNSSSSSSSSNNNLVKWYGSVV